MYQALRITHYTSTHKLSYTANIKHIDDAINAARQDALVVDTTDHLDDKLLTKGKGTNDYMAAQLKITPDRQIIIPGILEQNKRPYEQHAYNKKPYTSTAEPLDRIVDRVSVKLYEIDQQSQGSMTNEQYRVIAQKMVSEETSSAVSAETQMRMIDQLVRQRMEAQITELARRGASSSLMRMMMLSKR